MFFQLVCCALLMTSATSIFAASDNEGLLATALVNHVSTQIPHVDPYATPDRQRDELIQAIDLRESFCGCLNSELRELRNQLYYENGPWDTQPCSKQTCLKHAFIRCHKFGVSIKSCEVPCICMAAGCAAGATTIACCSPGCTVVGSSKVLFDCLITTALVAACSGVCPNLIKLSEKAYRWTSNPENWPEQQGEQDGEALVHLMANED